MDRDEILATIEEKLGYKKGALPEHKLLGSCTVYLTRALNLKFGTRVDDKYVSRKTVRTVIERFLHSGSNHR